MVVICQGEIQVLGDTVEDIHGACSIHLWDIVVLRIGLRILLGIISKDPYLSVLLRYNYTSKLLFYRIKLQSFPSVSECISILCFVISSEGRRFPSGGVIDVTVNGCFVTVTASASE